MIFVDASALVAIAVKEPDAMTLVAILETDDVLIHSAISAWETVAAICRTNRFDLRTARSRVSLLAQTLNLRLVTVGEGEAELALDAYARFGKGRHPAALNMGDCFAYACAKANNAKLLFEGDDFTKTDIIAA